MTPAPRTCLNACAAREVRVCCIRVHVLLCFTIFWRCSPSDVAASSTSPTESYPRHFPSVSQAGVACAPRPSTRMSSRDSLVDPGVHSGEATPAVSPHRGPDTLHHNHDSFVASPAEADAAGNLPRDTSGSLTRMSPRSHSVDRDQPWTEPVGAAEKIALIAGVCLTITMLINNVQ